MNPNQNPVMIYSANNVILVENVLPENKINSLKEYMKRFMHKEEGVTANAEPPSEGGNKSPVRSCEVAWIQPDTKFTSEVIQQVSNTIININHEWFGYTVHRPEPIQYTMYEYKEENEIKDHYNWHQDSWGNSRTNPIERKLSMSVQLSHSDEYEGCNLIFPDTKTRDLVNSDPNAPYGMNMYNGQSVTVSEWDELQRKKGTAIFFQSTSYHRVTPIESGSRYALVNWLQGPKWR